MAYASLYDPCRLQRTQRREKIRSGDISPVEKVPVPKGCRQGLSLTKKILGFLRTPLHWDSPDAAFGSLLHDTRAADKKNIIKLMTLSVFPQTKHGTVN